VSEQFKHGKKPGTTGYRKGCRCPECIAANAEYLRAWRERKRAEQLPEPPTPEPVVDELSPAAAEPDAPTPKLGPIEAALAHDLDHRDGDPTFLKEVARTVARSLDGAVRTQRHDLVSPLAQRLVDIGARLFPPKVDPSGGLTEDEKRAQVLQLIQGGAEEASGS